MLERRRAAVDSSFDEIMNANIAIPAGPRRLLRFQRALALTLVWLGASLLAIAQPRISSPPRNVAVPLGQDAQFRVSASGAAPLAYAWRFNGTPLEGQTTNSLTLTNIGLAQLGGYEVTVSNGAGTITSAPAWLLLMTRWSELVFFGASDGQQMCATGPPWIVQLADRIGLRLRNYSAAGAGNTAVRAQIAAYLASSTPTTNSLFSFWVGGSEEAAAGLTERAASNRLDHVRALAVAGARSFLIPRIPPLEFAPAFRAMYPSFRNEMAIEYDALLDAGLDLLQAEYDLTVFRPNLFAWTTAVWESPEEYGFPSPPTAGFYCDGFHNTFAAHQLISEECYRWMTPPSILAVSMGIEEGTLELQWQGGSPPFRVQQCDDPANAAWQSQEATFETNARVPRAAPQRFFRVLNLGQ